ncbi:hypothetical protein HMPREF9141_2089 [Prevotella multiformis DSM 16608]|uniref:Uncharacterized protein n=1 Tax=Prevotella multiformis DSM 16608 TaxID=888743 RepID=F0F922_9BACT|nr:hypothetical protein HMPREF9141_2089 [Prevotella multiformis DSM 16608]
MREGVSGRLSAAVIPAHPLPLPPGRRHVRFLCTAGPARIVRPAPDRHANGKRIYQIYSHIIGVCKLFSCNAKQHMPFWLLKGA